jgi:hypothetical protein
MKAGIVYEELSALLEGYLERFGMTERGGPLGAMGEVVRGIVWTGSVQLTNAVRLTAETPADLEQGVKRVAKQLGNPRWNDRAWRQGILREQVQDMGEDDLVPIDATELAKPYAKKMQYQCTVRDASRPGDSLVAGYWCWGAYRWNPRTSSLRALMLRPYSSKQPAFRSENAAWGRFAWELHQVMGEKGIWLSDRGADRPEVLSVWLRLRRRWIIRLREDRALVGPDNMIRPAGVWADWALVNRPPLGRAVTLEVYLPREDVAQEGPAVRLHLVVPTYTFGSGQRWILLTRGLIGHHVGPRQVRYDYAGRWRSEDAKRFLGQLWHVERFLVRSFLALERLLWCVVAASGFLARLQDDEPDLTQALQNRVVYWDKPFLIPAYRLSRGLFATAQRYGRPALAVNA